MAKYEVTFSCGHTKVMNLYGPNASREKRIAYYEEQGLCPECYAKAQAEKMAQKSNIVEMHYGEYKRRYAMHKTVPGSYNPETKTIKVYLPKPSDSTLRTVANLSKSEIFKAAHELTRKALAGTTGYSYQATFAICLKEDYAIIKSVKADLNRVA